jgi:hypothetical protein
MLSVPLELMNVGGATFDADDFFRLIKCSSVAGGWCRLILFPVPASADNIPRPTELVIIKLWACCTYDQFSQSIQVRVYKPSEAHDSLLYTVLL